MEVIQYILLVTKELIGMVESNASKTVDLLINRAH